MKYKVGELRLLQNSKGVYYTVQIISKLKYDNKIYYVAARVKCSPEYGIFVLNEKGFLIYPFGFKDDKYFLTEKSSSKKRILEKVKIYDIK